MTGGATYSSYNPEKHGWHDPRGQMETMRLNDPPQSRSWAWTMRKSCDHLGYGEKGMIGWGDIQCTAVSGDGPEWFVGTKTVPGPFTTETVPVRRCPVVHIEGKHMGIRGKTYEHAGNLQTSERMHDTNKVPLKGKRPVRDDPLAKAMFKPNKAKMCSLIHGGCQTKEDRMPLSRHVIHEGRTQRAG